MKLNKGMYSITLLAGVALLGAQGAYADVTAVYKMTSPNNDSGTQTIRYTDMQHVRIDMADTTNRKTSILKLGDKVYVITGKVVQDISQLSRMMASMGMGKKNGHKTQAPIKFKDTGRTETIAGISGKVYRFVEKGKSHEVVLGQNKDLQNAVLGAVEITKAMAGIMPSDSTNWIQRSASMKSRALLRLDDQIHLRSMNTHAVPAATFKLPSKPQQMGELINGAFGR